MTCSTEHSEAMLRLLEQILSDISRADGLWPAQQRARDGLALITAARVSQNQRSAPSGAQQKGDEHVPTRS